MFRISDWFSPWNSLAKHRQSKIAYLSIGERIDLFSIRMARKSEFFIEFYFIGCDPICVSIECESGDSVVEQSQFYLVNRTGTSDDAYRLIVVVLKYGKYGNSGASSLRAPVTVITE